MINNVATESSLGVQQVAHATESLSSLTNNLQENINSFKVDSNSVVNRNINTKKLVHSS